MQRMIVGETAGIGLGSVRPGANTPPLVARAVPSPAPAPARKTRGVRTAVVWASVGFIAGAVFWHVVGFWSFLSGVVLQSAQEARAELMNSATPAKGTLADQTETPLPTIYMVDPANCTSLLLDRGANRTVVRPCPSNGLALRLEAEGGREDLAGLALPRQQAAR